MPARPDVPTVKAAELTCLSDAAYEALAVRDQKLLNHIELLEALLRTTHESDTPPVE